MDRRTTLSLPHDTKEITHDRTRRAKHFHPLGCAGWGSGIHCVAIPVTRQVPCAENLWRVRRRGVVRHPRFPFLSVFDNVIPRHLEIRFGDCRGDRGRIPVAVLRQEHKGTSSQSAYDTC